MSGKELVGSTLEDCEQLDGRIILDTSVIERSLTKLSAIAAEYTDDPTPPYSSELQTNLTKIPQSNIVIQVVGSRGGVQPFIALGLALKQKGHRVRLATHPIFKEFVEISGLEFFSIGGNPAELMAYMVSNPEVIPKFTTIKDGEVKRRTEGISQILLGCWHSCFRICDDGDEGFITQRMQPALKNTPFVADLIIANPPSFAHIHCAEKLGIPLHIMFTMPWSPTRAFPHPLVNVAGSKIDPTLANYLSYPLFESIAWQGLGSVINKFRSKILRLDRLGQVSAVGALQRLRIPHTYCWSENLINRPADWGSDISIAGLMRIPESLSYQPSVSLTEFLAAEPPPIYIGFGSIVVDNVHRLTEIILETLRITGVRAIISAGWANLGTAAQDKSPHIFQLGDCPHDWLFPRVSCVVHHGGAGTTFAGLIAGKPTGASVYHAGAGPKPIPWKALTSENLAQAIDIALGSQVRATAYSIGLRLKVENGTERAVQSIEASLPLDKMRCSILDDRSAAWKVKSTKIRLSAVAMEALNEAGLIQYTDVKLSRACEHKVNHGPWDPVSGGSSEIYRLFYDTFKGIAQIGSEFAPIRLPIDPDPKIGAKKQEIAVQEQDLPSRPLKMQKRPLPGVQATKGITRIVKAAARAPMKFTVAMAQGAHNTPKLWGDKTVRPPLKVSGIGSGLSAGCQELFYGTYDGITGLVVQPIHGAIDNGLMGFTSGIAKGIINLPLKFWAGMSGVVGFPLQGIDKQIQRAVTHDPLDDVRSARRAQGAFEYALLSNEEKAQILAKWQLLTV